MCFGRADDQYFVGYIQQFLYILCDNPCYSLYKTHQLSILTHSKHRDFSVVSQTYLSRNQSFTNIDFCLPRIYKFTRCVDLGSEHTSIPIYRCKNSAVGLVVQSDNLCLMVGDFACDGGLGETEKVQMVAEGSDKQIILWNYDDVLGAKDSSVHC